MENEVGYDSAKRALMRCGSMTRQLYGRIRDAEESQILDEAEAIARALGEREALRILEDAEKSVGELRSLVEWAMTKEPVTKQLMESVKACNRQMELAKAVAMGVAMAMEQQKASKPARRKVSKRSRK